MNCELGQDLIIDKRVNCSSIKTGNVVGRAVALALGDL